MPVVSAATVIVCSLGQFASSAWLSLLLRAAFHRGLNFRIPTGDGGPAVPQGGWPTLAVVFAARDEAGEVEKATLSLLAQDYPGIRVVAVDDRSTDGTGVILDRLAADDPRLHVTHVTTLPAGWLGKNHALQCGADGAADAEWILFTDADVVFEPAALRRTVAWALARGVDHLTLAPDVPTETYGERVFIAFFCLLLSLAAPPWRVVDPRRKAAVGVGAFNLVRAEVFQAVGGYRRISLSVDDDMRLGRALKFAGYRGGVILGQGLASVRWQVGLTGMVRGLEKNFFAATDYRLAYVPLGVVMILLLGVFPTLGLFVGPWWSRLYCALGIATQAAILSQAHGQNGVRWYHALGLPIGALAFAFALVRSTYVTLRDGGVHWRDHHYPLSELRSHVRARNAWSREIWRATR